MPQSLANLAVHLVFSTKDRKAFLADTILRTEMHKQLGRASKTLDCLPLAVGGVEDHVHMLARMSRSITIAKWVKEIKRVASLWIKEREPSLAAFHWQAGYGVFSVSQSEIARVIDSILKQSEHHHQRDFKEEFRLLLQLHEIEYDERYAWD